MSTLASSLEFAVVSFSTSPERGFKGGSSLTSLHVSVNILAVIFQRILWGRIINSPFLQDNACLRSNLEPHAQSLGRRDN